MDRLTMYFRIDGFPKSEFRIRKRYLYSVENNIDNTTHL